MKKFIKDYLKIISISITGLVFILASFYLIINYYHSEEINRKLYIGENEINYKNYKEKLTKINENLVDYRNKNNNNSAYKGMYNNLVTCYKTMNEEGTLANIKTDSFYSAYDIYKLGGKFQSHLLNTCWALHLSYIKNDNDKFKEISPFIVNNIETITNQANNALSEIQNNSSYFYTTNITASTVRNYLNSDYKMIADSYNEFADIILLLSEKINDGGM